MERTALLSRCTGEKLVKNVERPLVLGLSNGTALLQQVSLNIRPSNVPTRVKVDANEFTLHKNKSNKNQKIKIKTTSGHSRAFGNRQRTRQFCSLENFYSQLTQVK
jgi:hypothetical protein